MNNGETWREALERIRATNAPAARPQGPIAVPGVSRLDVRRSRSPRAAAASPLFLKEVLLLPGPDAFEPLNASNCDYFDSHNLRRIGVSFDRCMTALEVKERIIEVFDNKLRGINFSYLRYEFRQLRALNTLPNQEVDGALLYNCFKSKSVIYIKPATKIIEDEVEAEPDLRSYDMPLLDGEIDFESANDNAGHQAAPAPIAAPTINDLLRELHASVDHENPTKIEVEREDILHSMGVVLDENFNFQSGISIEFKGEPGVDAGGLTRECLRLCMLELERADIFAGPRRVKNLQPVSRGTNDKLYILAGVLIGFSFTFGGPRPHFFSPFLYDAIALGPDNSVPSVTDITVSRIQKTLTEFQNCETVEKANEFLDSSEALRILSSKESLESINDRDSVIEDVVKFYCVTKLKPAFDLLCSGLKKTGILEILRRNPELFRPYFLINEDCFTMLSFIGEFEIMRSTTGTDAWRTEKKVLQLWMKLLKDIDNELIEISYEDICIYATGLEHPPAGGFVVKPKLLFQHDKKWNVCPEAEECSNKLLLPIKRTEIEEYADFKHELVTVFKNRPSFSRA